MLRTSDQLYYYPAAADSGVSTASIPWHYHAQLVEQIPRKLAFHANGMQKIPLCTWKGTMDESLLRNRTFILLLQASNDAYYRYRPDETKHIYRWVSPAFLLSDPATGQVFCASAAASVSALLTKYKDLRARCDGHRDGQVFHNLICQLILEEDGVNLKDCMGGDTWVNVNASDRVLFEKAHFRFLICNFTNLLHGATLWDWNRGLFSIYVNMLLLKWSHQWRVVRFDGHHAWIIPRPAAEIEQATKEFAGFKRDVHRSGETRVPSDSAGKVSKKK